MAVSLIVLTAMYYAFSKGLYEPLDKLSRGGVALQYIIIIDALVTIPLATLQKMQFSESNTTGISTLSLDGQDDVQAIYDLTGRLMKQSKQTTIDLGRLPQGLYVVKIFDHSGNSIIRKVIKQ